MRFTNACVKLRCEGNDIGEAEVGSGPCTLLSRKVNHLPTTCFLSNFHDPNCESTTDRPLPNFLMMTENPKAPPPLPKPPSTMAAGATMPDSLNSPHLSQLYDDPNNSQLHEWPGPGGILKHYYTPARVTEGMLALKKETLKTQHSSILCFGMPSFLMIPAFS